MDYLHNNTRRLATLAAAPANKGPVHVGAQFLASNIPASDGLNGDTSLHGDGSHTGTPLTDRGRLNANKRPKHARLTGPVYRFLCHAPDNKALPTRCQEALPNEWGGGVKCLMLTGKKLGAAIRVAIEKKQVSLVDVARHFSVKPPSVQGWMNTGRISKPNFEKLRQYLADVAGPEHWGLPPECTAGTKYDHATNEVIELMLGASKAGRLAMLAAARLMLSGNNRREP